MEGAKDKKNPDIDYASLVSALKARGVRFEVCEITLRSRNIEKDRFIMDADFTPSGVVRIGQLQSREKYAYIKP
jgi:intracellular sulfur oxidation DsrE/DsrF family protein